MTKKEYTICEGIEWIDITDPNAEALSGLIDTYGLNNYLVKDCLEPDHLPKFDVSGNFNFVILRYYTFKSEKGSSTIQQLTNKLAIFYNEKVLITIHLAEISFLDLIYKRNIQEMGCSSTAEVLMRIVWYSLASFDDPVQRLSEQIDFHENNILVRKNEEDQLTQLYFIKRQASMLHKVVMLMVEPINHLPNNAEFATSLQDVKDEHLKIQTLFSQVLDEVTNLMNLHMSYTSHRNNEVMKVLTIFSVFFLPITFVTGFFGMNFKKMAEMEKNFSYPSVILVMLFIIGGIFYWFKKKGWMK